MELGLGTGLTLLRRRGLPLLPTSNLAAHYAASALAAGAVSSWTDLSGNGRHATQATGGKQPVTTAGEKNGQNALVFDTTDDCLQTASTALTAGNQLTVYAVVKAASGTDRIIAEQSASYSTNAGSWVMYRSAADKVVAGVRGNTGAIEWTTTATVTTSYRIVTARYDMGITRFETMAFIDGVRGGSWTTLIAAGLPNTGNFAAHVLNIGSRNNGASLRLNGGIAELLIYAERHNAAQRKAVEAYLSAKYAIPVTVPASAIVFEGDSLTEGDQAFANAYPTVLMAALTGNHDWINTGVSGQTLATMATDRAAQIDPFYSAGIARNVCVMWGGTNDMSTAGGNQTAATTLTRYYAHADALRTAGFSTIGLTMLPRSDAGIPGDFNTKRATFNTDVRANWASHLDALVDVAADTRIGDDGDSDDLTYYAADKVHLTIAGYQIIADLVAPALAAVGIV